MADNMQNFQDSPPDGELAQQTTGTTLATSPFSATEQTNTFSTIAAMTQETNTQPTTESVKPIILPSGVIVHEHEVMQQLAERFRLSSKNIDSRINLKLHPAELGELKIDLTLKDGVNPCQYCRPKSAHFGNFRKKFAETKNHARKSRF